MLTTFYLLYVMAGGGALNQAWGGPAILRFDDIVACEAAATVMKNRKNVFHVECVQVTTSK